MIEPKKLALLRILEILKEHSDFEHPLKQEDIAKYLEQEYGIVIERKAIGRNISLLREAGYEIESNRNGSYLSQREFEDSELRLLIDGVLCSRYINVNHSRDLIQKLCNLSSKYFTAHVKNIHSLNDWSKSENQSLFYNIELIDEAINTRKQITFHYNKYGIDKKLHVTKRHTVSPYQLLLHNQHYYLMSLHEYFKNITYYRLDHITDISITEDDLTDVHTVPGYENGINYGEISSSNPYLFSDDLEMITFLADKEIIDAIVEWFGDSARIEEKEDKLEVTVKASPNAMEFWALQYLYYVEVIKPESLRKSIYEDIQKGFDRYKQN